MNTRNYNHNTTIKRNTANTTATNKQFTTKQNFIKIIETYLRTGYVNCIKNIT